jgi:hypothetical protein
VSARVCLLGLLFTYGSIGIVEISSKNQRIVLEAKGWRLFPD